MNQKTATDISNAILDWRDAESVHLLHFPIKPESNQERTGQGRKNPKTKTFQQLITEAAQEQVAMKCAEDHIGIRYAFWVWKRNQDLSNLEKSIEDAIKNIAFGDDHLVDYVEKVRVRAPSPEDQGFTVEVLKLTPKREAWI